MKKLLITLTASIFLGGNVMAKSLVVYFSATGTTKGVAEKIAKAEKCDIVEIIASQPYTDADLNWHDKKSRTSVECNKLDSVRPEIKNLKEIDVSGYDRIYIGYPIWWGEAPNIIYTFVENKNLDGKTIVPFCTSGGSGMGPSARNLSKKAPKAVWKKGAGFYANPSDAEIKKLLEQ